MSLSRQPLHRPSWLLAVAFAALLFCCQLAQAQVGPATSGGYIQITNAQTGNAEWVLDDRKPSLYTGDFGDCMGDSVINVTRFDASYYKDNATVMFHLAGNTALVNESVMIYMGVYAYGESRFNLTFNPCNANIKSMCPLNSSVPVEASGIIPISEQQVADFPPIALVIPDFEGQAILRVFSNSTESQIACYSAVLTNGATFSHPSAVGSVLGLFAAVAVISSFAVTTHGNSVSDTRKHYAHSISVFVVFAVFHHIFFTGALSMNWPGVLVAFWSNYAWSAGMIYSSSMQNMINKFIGQNQGNISIVGAAAPGSDAANVGGGYEISAIYKRMNSPDLLHRTAEELLSKRDDLVNKSSGYSWYGHAVRPGLPLPGNYSGFAGALAPEAIAVSDAFMTAFLWFLVLLAGLILSVILVKYTIEGLNRIGYMKTERLHYFRENWVLFMVSAVLRCLFIAFFMFMLLTIFQFDFGGSAGVLAIAGVVFSIFFLSMFGLAGSAVYSQCRAGRLTWWSNNTKSDRKQKRGFMPWFRRTNKTAAADGNAETETSHESKRSSHMTEQEIAIHDDERFTRRFGWLSSKYRQSRWWFPATWLVYEFIRACFYGGAANHPLVQVFGLLVVEFIAFIFIVWVKPFESTRLNLIMVYLLGISKVLTVALSSAFDVRFSQGRIICTAIGIVIIVIQGILTIALLIAITLGAFSSYMSLTRNHENFHPRRWRGMREKYFKHVDQAARDRPPSPPPPAPVLPEIPTEPYFKVGSVTRQLKIEDEDENPDSHYDPRASLSGTPLRPESRAQSIHSVTSRQNLPYGARPHRTSWSSKDFDEMYRNSGTFTPRHQDSGDGLREAAMRQRAATMRSPVPPRFDTPPNQIRATSLRGPGSSSPFEMQRSGGSGAATPEAAGPSSGNSSYSHAPRHSRSGSMGKLLNQQANIDEEMEIQEVRPPRSSDGIVGKGKEAAWPLK